jgi:hypothetical protein
MVTGRGRGRIAEIEDRGLAEQPVLLLTWSIPLREAPVESSAPQLTSDSRARLFATAGSTRSVKFQIDVNGPF